MKKTIVTIALATAGLVGTSNAALISFNNIGSGTPLDSIAIVYAGTTQTASGGIAAAGFFSTLSTTQVNDFAAANDFASLIGDFVVAASTTLDSGFGGALPGSGLYDANASNITLPNATRAGEPLYTFIGNEPTLGASNQFILWRHTDVINEEDTVTNPDSNALLLAEEGVAVIAGSLTTVTVDFSPLGGPTTTIAGIQMIPEPSTALVGLLGVGLLALRRRRD